MRTFSVAALIASALLLAGCAGEVKYTPPASSAPIQNSAVIKQSFKKVWPRLVKNLARDFYVINNIDKESGLINVSYSSNPETIIDCGHIRSYVKNARGERTYDFPAATASKQYETMDTANGLSFINRKMEAEGRANIIVQPIDPHSTSITVNTKYVVTKTVHARNAMGQTGSISDTINFTSGGSAEFPSYNSNQSGTACHSTGKLERDVIAAAKP